MSKQNGKQVESKNERKLVARCGRLLEQRGQALAIREQHLRGASEALNAAMRLSGAVSEVLDLAREDFDIDLTQHPDLKEYFSPTPEQSTRVPAEATAEGEPSSEDNVVPLGTDVKDEAVADAAKE